jgi:hypothetical protein
MGSNNSLIQKALFLKNLRIRFESSMSERQKKAFFSDCVRLSQEILIDYSFGPSFETNALDALKVLSPCMPKHSKSPMFLALEFKVRATQETSTTTQAINEDALSERFTQLETESNTLCNYLLDHVTQKTEEDALEALDLIQETLQQIKTPKQARKITKIEPPRYYSYR